MHLPQPQPRRGRIFTSVLFSVFFLTTIILFLLFSDQLRVLPPDLHSPVAGHNDHSDSPSHGHADQAPPQQEHQDSHEDSHEESHDEPHDEPQQNSPGLMPDPFLLHPKDHILRKPTTHELEWKVTKELRSPDGVEKQVYLINGQFPGPIIEARSGDELKINVINNIDHDDQDGIAMHWHGLTMKGANHMDGALGVTQCAIPHGKNFTYQFNIDDDQYGTFWYHAHSAVKRADGLFGGLVIHKPVTKEADSDASKHGYGVEKLMLVGDWYHRPGEKALDWYLDTDHFANEPAPDSLLINGRGAFNCSNAIKAWPINCTETEPPTMDFADGTIRLRIINTGMSAGLSLAMLNAAMKPITVDGGGILSDTAPANTLGLIYPGQRLDVVAKGKPESMTIIIDEENMPIMNPALTTSQSFPVKWTGGEKEKVTKTLDLASLEGETADLSINDIQKAVLYTTVKTKAAYHNKPVGSFNHSSWIPADPKAKPMLAMNKDDWHMATKELVRGQTFNVPEFEAGDKKWLELVINNADDKGHPFHVHGFNFYVAAVGQTPLGRPHNPFENEVELNTKTAIKRDTVYIPSRGYAVLHFALDNPGLWLMHCHVLWHQAVGMGMVMKVGEIDKSSRDAAAAYCT